MSCCLLYTSLNQALVILIGQIVAAVINYIPYVGGIVGTILSIFLFEMCIRYRCKIAMDIVAKHMEPDDNGVRIAELDEISYRLTKQRF